MGEVSEAVKKVCAMLGAAESDTEKFAALFLVTKLIKSKNCTTASKRAIFEAIGFGFLEKLLLAKDVPVDCPPVVYKSVALSILTCFCDDPELATHPEMLANIPVFLDIVSQADTADFDDNLIIVREAYSCLQSVASHQSGLEALLHVGAVKRLSEIYAQQSFQTDEALSVLVKVAARFGPTAWDSDPKPFHALTNKIALDFETDHTERKFELCSVLCALITSCRQKIIATTSVDETWPGSVFKGLWDVLHSRISKTQREPALALAAATIGLLGVEWTLQDEQKPKEMLLMLVQLSAIEVRMLDGASLKQALALSDVLASCFALLEACVAFIAADNVDLEQREKQSVYTSLKGAFGALLGILRRVSTDKKKQEFTPNEKALLQAMVRVLVSWLANETSALRAQVYELLPFILTVANESFHEMQASKASAGAASSDAHESEDSVDVLRAMLPALCHLTVEDDARRILLECREDEVLLECLKFHWTIVHWKRPPVPRAERAKALAKPPPGPDAATLERMTDSRAAMISTCNVFMNLTVLEPKRVETDPVYDSLIKFVLDVLPELKDNPENLVLHGNLAVLGLLLLKQRSAKASKNDFSITRYVQATIRFLWDAYSIDESVDPGALSVSLAYKERWMELAELWYLGMQTLAGVLQHIPWISEFALESGWVEGVVDTLRKVKVGALEPNVKSAYEDLLCRLVDANPAVPDVLKKHDALRVCRNHRLMELGKRLFGD